LIAKTARLDAQAPQRAFDFELMASLQSDALIENPQRDAPIQNPRFSAACRP
jgi:hypothetical protein